MVVVVVTEQGVCGGGVGSGGGGGGGTGKITAAAVVVVVVAVEAASAAVEETRRRELGWGKIVWLLSVHHIGRLGPRLAGASMGGFELLPLFEMMAGRLRLSSETLLICTVWFRHFHSVQIRY